MSLQHDVLLLDHHIGRLPTNFRLMRLIEWAGYSIKDFPVACVSPDQDRPWEGLPSPPKVIVPMGPWAVASLGLPGALSDIRGYVTSVPGSTGTSPYAVPTVGPGYIQRGNSRWSAAFIADLQKAVELARRGLPVEFGDYLLDPRPLDALLWARAYIEALRNDPRLYLAFDIETPGKGDEEESLDTDGDAPDRTWRIERIGFSYRGLSGISFPWSPEYIPAVRMLLGSHGPKVVWNAGFDVPRLRRAGISIAGTIHDGMVAWHILHSDLPKSLKFVATFTCPWQPAWKHLSGSKPAFYNVTDADVEVRSMQVIEDQLKKAQLWDVYERDVVALEPILVHMHLKGMPIDPLIREDRAKKLAARLADVKAKMEACVPLEARKVEHVYVSAPKDRTGLWSRRGTRQLKVCPACGAESPQKSHYRVLKKKVNPCGGLSSVVRDIEVDEWYRLADFTPSRDQLTRYHHHLGRPLPMVFDKKARAKKVSFAERQIKEMVAKYPQDVLYLLILEYREADKVAGTYIGRPA